MHRELYDAVRKPYLAATEGNEHAHQEMKRFFHTLCAHNSKHKSNVHDCLDKIIARRAINYAGTKEMPRGKRNEMFTGVRKPSIKRNGEARKEREAKTGDFAAEETKFNLREAWQGEDQRWATAKTDLLDQKWIDMLAKRAREHPSSE